MPCLHCGNLFKFSFFQIGSGQSLDLRQNEELRREESSRREDLLLLGEEGDLCDWMKMQGWWRTASGDKRENA